jgi:hypothetical protein
MNKHLLKLGLVVALSLMASSAFATAEVTKTVIGGGTFSPSNNVKIFCTSSVSAYDANSAHKQGDKQFYSGNASPNIAYTTKGIGTDITTVTVSTTGWSTL